MAKRKKKVEEVSGEELLSGETEVKVVETETEVKAEIHPKKEKKFIGRHPITKEEIWK